MCTKVLRLSQPEAAMQQAFSSHQSFGRLGVTRRCYVFALLVKVMGLRWGCGYIEFFDMPCSNMDDFIDVLKSPLN